MDITLHPITPDEWERVKPWRLDAEAVPQFRTSDDTDAAQREPFPLEDGPHRYYAVRIRDAFLGLAGLINLTAQPGLGDLALALAPDYRSLAYVRPILNAVIREAFTALDLQVVQGCCFRDNTRALALWMRLLSPESGIVHDHAGDFLAAVAVAQVPPDEEPEHPKQPRQPPPAHAVLAWRIVRQLPESTRRALRERTERAVLSGEGGPA